MKWGIIGTGNMGSMLTTVLIKSGAVKEDHLYVYNRSREKPALLKDQFPDIHMTENVWQIAEECTSLFICVKPHQYKSILDQLTEKLSKDHCLISITSPIAVEELEEVTPCQVARVVPSITNHALSGVSLFTFGTRITKENKKMLKETFHLFSSPIEVEESHIRVASDIVSCGPAFISYLLKEWITAAHHTAGISIEQATELTEAMMVGTGELFAQEIFTLEELMQKVTVKGGVTGEGLKALEEHTGSLFQYMFQATQQKHQSDKSEIKLT